MIPEKNINLINDYNVSKEMFPMYSEISFTTDTSTEIAGTFSELNLNCLLMKSMYESLTLPPEDYYTAGVEVEGDPIPEEDAMDWVGDGPPTMGGAYGEVSSLTSELESPEARGTDVDAARAADRYRRYRGLDDDDDAARNPCSPMGDMSVYKQRFYTQTDIPTMGAGSTACDPRVTIKSRIRYGYL